MMKRKKLIYYLIRIAAAIGVFSLLYIIAILITNIFIFPNDIIGTYFEVPAPNNYKIAMFDTAYIEGNDGSLALGGVDSLQVVKEYVIGKKYGAGYFRLDTRTGQCEEYASREDLKQVCGSDRIKLRTLYDYYWWHRLPADVLIGISLLLISWFVGGLFCRRFKFLLDK